MIQTAIRAALQGAHYEPYTIDGEPLFVDGEPLAALIGTDFQAVAALLAKYEFDSGLPEPAVFADEIPEAAQYPAIVVNAISGSGGGGTRGSRGFESAVDVQVFGNKSHTRKMIRDIAWEVWKALDRADLSDYMPADFNAFALFADPPIHTQDGFGFPGYTVRCRAQVQEAA